MSIGKILTIVWIAGLALFAAITLAYYNEERAKSASLSSELTTTTSEKNAALEDLAASRQRGDVAVDLLREANRNAELAQQSASDAEADLARRLTESQAEAEATFQALLESRSEYGALSERLRQTESELEAERTRDESEALAMTRQLEAERSRLTKSVEENKPAIAVAEESTPAVAVSEEAVVVEDPLPLPASAETVPSAYQSPRLPTAERVYLSRQLPTTEPTRAYQLRRKAPNWNIDDANN